MSMLVALKGSAITMADTHRDEFYPTPASLVRVEVKRNIRAWRDGLYINGGGYYYPDVVRVLDLCAGSGVWGIIAKQELGAFGYKVHLVGVEINEAMPKPPEFDEWVTVDFREAPEFDKFDFIFTNPRFSQAVETALYAKSVLHYYGKFAMLISNNFGFAASHAELFDVWTPEHEDKLTKRPSFLQPFAERYNEKIDELIKCTKDEEEIKKLKKSRAGNMTNAKDYVVYRFGYESSYLDKVWFTDRVHWDYEDDPVHDMLLERPVMVMAALAREAAYRRGHEKGRDTFDDYPSFMAAREYGWAFYMADDEERLRMIGQL